LPSWTELLLTGGVTCYLVLCAFGLAPAVLIVEYTTISWKLNGELRNTAWGCELVCRWGTIRVEEICYLGCEQTYLIHCLIAVYVDASITTKRIVERSAIDVCIVYSLEFTSLMHAAVYQHAVYSLYCISVIVVACWAI
jgi:hypothetical protein